MKLVNLINVQKVINNVKILDNINISIDQGEFISLMGPSGCGKTTTLNIIGAMDRLTSGNYYFAEEDITTMSDYQLAKFRSNNLGFIFQSFHLLNRYTVYENIKLSLEYLDKSIKNIEQEIDIVLDLVNLSEKKNSLITELSGGQMQRVAIARALIKKPQLILADEPTGNLDSKSSEAVMSILNKLHQAGATILVITHDQNIADQTQRIIHMKDGKLI
jgi:putative ABC transport system ATP-binding protein